MLRLQTSGQEVLDVRELQRLRVLVSELRPREEEDDRTVRTVRVEDSADGRLAMVQPSSGHGFGRRRTDPHVAE